MGRTNENKHCKKDFSGVLQTLRKAYTSYTVEVPKVNEKFTHAEQNLIHSLKGFVYRILTLAMDFKDGTGILIKSSGVNHPFCQEQLHLVYT